MTIAPLTYVGPLSPSGADFNNIILKLNEVALANGAPVSDLLRAPNAADDVKLNTIILALNVVLATLGLPLHPLATDPLHPSGVQVNALIARLNDAVFETNNPSGYTLPVIEGFQNFSGNIPTGGLLWVAKNFNASHGTLVSSGLHVGYGTASGLATSVPDYFNIFTGDQYGASGNAGIDLTGYNSVKLDVYISQADDGEQLAFAANPRADWSNQSGGAQQQTSPGQTGQITVSLDISAWPDKTQVVFDIETFNEGVGNFTAYLQKLYAA